MLDANGNTLNVGDEVKFSDLIGTSLLAEWFGWNWDLLTYFIIGIDELGYAIVQDKQTKNREFFHGYELVRVQ